MLQNAPTLAIVAVDTEENEPLKIWGDFFSYSVHSFKLIDFDIIDSAEALAPKSH